MELGVLSLTPERWHDLVELFSRPGRARGSADVRQCWCMYYRRSGTSGPGRIGRKAHFGGSPAENKLALRSLVDRGTVPGLIGYRNGRPVGWISLGPREAYARLRRSPMMKPVDDKPVWSIVCFFVDAGERGKGTSGALLRAAVDYARSRGATPLEAYPVDKKSGSYPAWFGAKSIFDRAGFKVVARRNETRLVMRRRLVRRT